MLAIKTIFLTLSLIYCALVAVLYVYQGQILYHPDTAQPDPEESGVPHDYISVEAKTTDGLNLNAWYFPSENPESSVVLMFHGNASHYGARAFKAPTFLDEGVSVLLAEYRGYGGNAGQITEAGLYNDARAYIQWLKDERGIAPEQIILYGESLGTGIAIQMATEYPVKAVILEAAYSSIPDVAKKIYFFVPVGLLIKDQYRSIDKINNVNAPILFIHGDRDQTISIDLARKLFDTANEPKTFATLSSAAHNDLYDFGAPLHIQEFLRNITKK